jgi:hypothetical protein
MLEGLMREGYSNGTAAEILRFHDMAWNLWRGMGEESDGGDDYPIPFLPFFEPHYGWTDDEDDEDYEEGEDDFDEDDEDDEFDEDEFGEEAEALREALGLDVYASMFENVVGLHSEEEQDEDDNDDDDSEDEMPPLIDATEDSPLPPYRIFQHERYDDMPPLVSHDDDEPPPLVDDDEPLVDPNPNLDPWTRGDWGPNVQSRRGRGRATATSDFNPRHREFLFQSMPLSSTQSTIPASARIRGSPPRHIPPPGRRRPRPPRVRRDHSRPRYTTRTIQRPPEENPWLDEENTTETDGEVSERERLRMRLSEESGINSPTWNSRNQDLQFFSP